MILKAILDYSILIQIRIITINKKKIIKELIQRPEQRLMVTATHGCSMMDESCHNW